MHVSCRGTPRAGTLYVGYGRRGERPWRFLATPAQAALLSEIPGVQTAMPAGSADAIVSCAWDSVNIVRKILGQVPLADPITDLRATLLAMPGLQRYVRLGFREKLRIYQREDVVFMALRHAAMNCNPMRSGKSAEALAGSVMIGAKRTLILCPAIATWVWADEIRKWIGEEALILYGRGADYARKYCKVCLARGRLDDGTQCTTCKARNGASYGYTIYDVQLLKPRTLSYALVDTIEYADKKTGALKQRKLTKNVQYTPLPPVFTCAKHDQVAEVKGGKCRWCLKELRAAIDAATYVICGYDLLVEQRTANRRGVEYDRKDLPGWQPFLSKHHFDLCIADEVHNLRGFNRGGQRKGKSRRDKAVKLAERISYVWGLTGTPIYGFVRDLWGQLDFVTGGLFGKGPYPFQEHYCSAHMGEFGWMADGKSDLADTELVERLETLKIQRPRSQILSQMPPKLRRVVRIDKPAAAVKPPDDDHEVIYKSSYEGEISERILANAAVKRPTVVENVLAELAEGAKVFVLAYRRKAAEALALDIAAAIASKDHGVRMRQVDAKLWFAHGDQDVKTRFDYAQLYKSHSGAAVFVSTIDAMQVAISLKGCTSVHFADWHYMPAAMLQAEDRGYEPGTTGLTITYYTVVGSVDEHLEELIMPKFEAQKAVVREEGAGEMLKLLGPDDNLAERALARFRLMAERDDE